ncbi:chemotaxis protein CheW [bacterium]|nr:chemotaxis protein CheW [bacterium]
MTKELLTNFFTDAKQHIGMLCKGKMSVATLSVKKHPSKKHLEAISGHLLSIMNGAHFVECDDIEALATSLEGQIMAFGNGEPVTKESLTILKTGCKQLLTYITQKEISDAEKESDIIDELEDIEAFAMLQDSDKTETLVAADTSQENKNIVTPKKDDIWIKNKDFVAFFIGKKQYAVPIFQVSEIRGLMPWTALPRQPKSILGLINLRGLVLPLFDLRVLLEAQQEGDGQSGVILILKNRKALQAFLVDSVTDVVQLNRRDRRATPRSGDPQSSGIVRFIGQDSNDNFLMVVDIEKIINAEGTI